MILNNSQLVEIRRMVEMVEIWSKHKLVTKGGALLLTSQTVLVNKDRVCSCRV